MADGIYVGMCGAAARTEQLDAIADNLANAQTPGFKAARPAFESFLPASGATDKAYPAAVATNVDLRPGPTSRTDNPLDIVPDDGAFLVVRLPSGERAFTRDGRLSLDAQRRLVQGDRLVLGTNGEPIAVPPGATPTIGLDGVVRVGDLGVGEIARYHLSGRVERRGANLMTPGAGGRAEPVKAQLRSGELELGNATALDGMVQLVSAQRHFDASMQALQTYRSLDGRSSELGRVR